MTRQDLDYSRERTLQSRVWSLEAENADLRRWKAMEKPLTAAMKVVASDVQKLRGEVKRLRSELRKLAIVECHRMAEGGGTVKTGHCCRLCDQGWSNGQAEVHRAHCALAATHEQNVSGGGKIDAAAIDRGAGDG